MKIHCGRFGWRMLPIWLLPAALCQHRHKQDASHYWGSKRSSSCSTFKIKSTVERNMVRWNTRIDWNCMIVTDKPEFNCSEYNTWKRPSFSVVICWKFEYKQSLKPNDLQGIQLYSSHSVACPTSIFKFWTCRSPLFQDISDFKLEIGQSLSAWKLQTQNVEPKLCNVSHSGL